MDWSRMFQASRKWSTTLTKLHLRCLSRISFQDSSFANSEKAIFNSISSQGSCNRSRPAIICSGRSLQGAKTENRDHRGNGETPKSAWLRNNLPLAALAATTVLFGQAVLKQSRAQCATAEVPHSAIGNVLGEGAQVEYKEAEEMTSQQKLRQAIEKARDICQRIKDERGAPGMVVGVSVDGTQVWTEGFGYADVENRVPCKAETVMRIASVSKPISMAIIARLVDQGKLDLHKPVTGYVKSWPEKYFQDEKVEITTHQLLSMMAGIRHYSKDCGKKTSQDKKTGKEGGSSEKKKNQPGKEKPEDQESRELFSKRRYDSMEAALTLFRDDPLCSKPGTEFLYTTHGWTLVSAVAEAASGQTFPKLCSQLFRDLGLKNTYLDEAAPLIYHRAKFYTKNKKGHLINAPYVDNSWKWAGGGMLSTASDLLRFGQVMLYAFQQDAATGPALPGYVKAKTMQQMWTPVPKTKCLWDVGTDTGYGLGWGVIPKRQTHGECRQQQAYVSHTGGAIGASSVLLIMPNDDSVPPPRGTVVSMMVNMEGVNLNRAALDVAALFQEAVVK